jgi:hypothetical protein
LTRSIDADATTPPIGEIDPGTGQAYETSLPGSWETLPAGYTASAFESKYPDAVFGTFVKDALRGISSGLGVAYNGIANDLENVNYSSIRAGVLEERDTWVELQNWLVEQLVEPVYREWLGLGLLAGAITFPAGAALPALKFDKFYPHSFTGRRWQWVDPEKDAQANILAVQHGWTTNEKVAAERGEDYWDNVEAIEQENTWADDHNVTLGDAPPPPPPAPPPGPDAATKAAELLAGSFDRMAASDAQQSAALAQLSAALAEQSRALLERPISVTVPVQMHEHHHHQRLKRKVPTIDHKTGRIVEFREEWIDAPAPPIVQQHSKETTP